MDIPGISLIDFISLVSLTRLMNVAIGVQININFPYGGWAEEE